ncbi:hypothetical protein CDL12_29524 [Handroanthus impetiginosus]|uniref:Uncharacterized protein n=1 Tax=Handroanthus impetiginosus TaxID=429701 RepID=A0A2G9FYJ9_9LAMI|nr:hypothetical protein CDL12_29524 [Handroanthus impetiginosus]
MDYSIINEILLNLQCTDNLSNFHILEPPCESTLLRKGDWSSVVQDDMNYMMSYVWANNPVVQDALLVRKGTIKEWKNCNKLVQGYYEVNVATAPYMATLKWIKHLNLTLDDGWRLWNVNGHVAGYTQRYKKDKFYLTFATILGAGHTAPEYNPEECYAMIDRWFSSFPL